MVCKMLSPLLQRMLVSKMDSPIPAKQGTELKCIWKGPTRHVSLQSLIHLKLRSLYKLTFIFTPSLAQSLVHLETLWIDDCRGLKHLIREKDDEKEIIPESVGFPKLKTLSIRGCDELEYVFPLFVSPSLLNLEEMIAFGANLKQIFYSGEGDALTRDGIINFPQLRVLSLLRCDFFSPKNLSAHLPSLQVLAIDRHEELGDLLVQLQRHTNLRELHIIDSRGGTKSSLTDLNLLSHLAILSVKIPDENGELKKLRLLDVTGCRDTRTLFPAKWQQALNNLTSVEIANCELLEEVFELGEVGEGINEEKELLSSLKRLDLRRLPELKCIWKGPTRHVSLQSLIHLKLRSLYKLTFIFTPSLAQSLVHLETLWIDDCKGLKHLIREKDDEKEIIPESVGFLKLKTLSISGCDELEYVFPISVSPSLVNLETLRIERCRGLKHLIREKDDEREIIPESLGFPKLKTLSIRGCDELEYVFPVSVSPSLLNLEDMKIVFGANLKQIFYSGEGDALTRDDIINFPQLRKLTLSSCNFFGPRNFTAHLPSLLVLYIQEHEELGDLLVQLQGHTNLREIHITDCEGAKEIMQVGSFVTNTRTGHEFSLLSLEKLDLSFLPDMRCMLKGLVLSHLTTLEVFYCQKLTHVFTGNMVASLVQLQFLKIFACEELKQIIAKDNDDEKDHILFGRDLQSLCFPNLCQVEINKCNKLRSLFPVAMALGLPKLKKLQVADSSQLLKVFGQDDHVSPVNVEKQMVFPNLSFLRLHNLPSIVCFSLGCNDLSFPCLEDFMVDECPNMTTKFARKTNGSMSAQSEVLLIRFDFMPFF